MITTLATDEEEHLVKVWHLVHLANMSSSISILLLQSGHCWNDVTELISPIIVLSWVVVTAVDSSMVITLVRSGLSSLRADLPKDKYLQSWYSLTVVF